jgi:hypothetical protein
VLPDSFCCVVLRLTVTIAEDWHVTCFSNIQKHVQVLLLLYYYALRFHGVNMREKPIQPLWIGRGEVISLIREEESTDDLVGIIFIEYGRQNGRAAAILPVSHTFATIASDYSSPGCCWGRIFRIMAWNASSTFTRVFAEVSRNSAPISCAGECGGVSPRE